MLSKFQSGTSIILLFMGFNWQNSEEKSNINHEKSANIGNILKIY